MARAVKDGLSLLIGAGVGVGLMYLFDPELGEKRRKTISKQAGSSVSDASDSVKSFASSVKESVKDHVPSLTSIGSLVSPAAGALKEAYEHLGEHLQGHLDTAHAKASGAVGDARAAGQSATDDAKEKLHGLQAKLVKDLSDRVSGLSGPLKEKYGEKYSKALKDLSLQLGRDEDHHYIGQTACALGSLALGAGVVYFLDPDKGHDRRDNMAASVSTTVGEIGSFFRKVGTRLIHRGQDLAGQAQDRMAPVIDKASDLKDRYLSGAADSNNSGYENSTRTYTPGE